MADLGCTLTCGPCLHTGQRRLLLTTAHGALASFCQRYQPEGAFVAHAFDAHHLHEFGEVLCDEASELVDCAVIRCDAGLDSHCRASATGPQQAADLLSREQLDVRLRAAEINDESMRVVVYTSTGAKAGVLLRQVPTREATRNARYHFAKGAHVLALLDGADAPVQAGMSGSPVYLQMADGTARPLAMLRAGDGPEAVCVLLRAVYEHEGVQRVLAHHDARWCACNDAPPLTFHTPTGGARRQVRVVACPKTAAHPDGRRAIYQDPNVCGCLDDNLAQCCFMTNVQHYSHVAI